MLTGILIRYDQNPTQDHLINAISISRKWSILNLYGYVLDHFRRQFLGRMIHPAVVLGVACIFGIPSLIEPAVKVLARPDISFSSWSTDDNVICHTEPLQRLFSMGHGNSDGDKTPWVMGKTMMYIIVQSMTHRRGPHGSWIVQRNGHPWVMDRMVVGVLMGDGSYGGRGTHGSWIIRWQGHP